MHAFHLSTLLLALSSLGHPAPVSHNFTLKREITPGLLSNLAFYEQYAAAAYCQTNNVPVAEDSNTPHPSRLTCPANNCPLVESASANSLEEFHHLGLGDTTGFVALDDANSLIIISFRGSVSFRNWLADLDFPLTNWPRCDGCQVASGFSAAWAAAESLVVSTVESATSLYPDYDLVVTGHSLGGALATLCAATLRDQDYTVALYTYGSPMVGNEAFATWVTESSFKNFRVTHADDPVPKLPGYEVLDYRHVSPEYWITSPNGINVGRGDVVRSDGVLDESGNWATGVGGSAESHRWYFNAVTSCAPPAF